MYAKCTMVWGIPLHCPMDDDENVRRDGWKGSRTELTWLIDWFPNRMADKGEIWWIIAGEMKMRKMESALWLASYNFGSGKKNNSYSSYHYLCFTIAIKNVNRMRSSVYVIIHMWFGRLQDYKHYKIPYTKLSLHNNTLYPLQTVYQHKQKLGYK